MLGRKRSDAYTSVQALRAVGALYLWRQVRLIGLVVALALAGLYGLTIWLALAFSAWWWLALILLVPWTLLAVALWLVLWALKKAVMPRELSKAERQKVESFLDDISEVADRASTPYPVLLFLIGRDVLRGRDSRFLGETVQNSKRVRDGFQDIRKLFDR